MNQVPFNTLQEFDPGNGKRGKLFSLPALEDEGIGRMSRLPISIRIILESVLRNYDGKKITGDHIEKLARWQPDAPRTEEVPFIVSRIVLQDFAGVPLLCDLAAMRGAAARLGVVGAFVEYFEEGAVSLSVPDRATVSNMAPEYGATMGFFPVDDRTVNFLSDSGRREDEVASFREYFKAQGLYGIPLDGDVEYSRVMDLDISAVKPRVAVPRRPQERIELQNLGMTFTEIFMKSVAEEGFGKKETILGRRFRTNDSPETGSGDVIIAAITSCTNTSNPAEMLAAGLLARKAVEKGLTVKEHVKTSLTPGSRVDAEYLSKAGLLPYLEKLGFHIAAYGCATCIGNTGPLNEGINEMIVMNDLVAGMGVLPLQFTGDDSIQSLNIRGNEEFDILGLENMEPQKHITLLIKRRDGSRKEVDLLARIDTTIEADYYRHGGILPYVLRNLLVRS